MAKLPAEEIRVSNMTENNREVITGSDFRRMVLGAYSEFLLEYETINQLGGAGTLPGTHVLRTMNAAVLELNDVKDESIGGLARRTATGAVFGARGNVGVVLAQIFRGIGKGLLGKYNATSSEFGKAFQYGILYAQRVIPGESERPIITVAKAVAKGAYHAVRSERPITEILEAALRAFEAALSKVDANDAGARIMFVFLTGCLKGLDGNFVSPAMNLSLGLSVKQPGMPDPRKDRTLPYCLRFHLANTKVNIPELEELLRKRTDFVLLERHEKYIDVHIHTDHVGEILEQAIGWGKLSEIHITNMSESHVLAAEQAVMPVAVLGIAANKVQAKEMQDLGVHCIVAGSEDNSPSVASLVGAAHSDLASTYVLVAWSREFWLVFRQVKHLLGNRVELVLCTDKNEQAAAVKAFHPKKTAEANARAMRKAAGVAE